MKLTKLVTEKTNLQLPFSKMIKVILEKKYIDKLDEGSLKCEKSDN